MIHPQSAVHLVGGVLGGVGVGCQVLRIGSNLQRPSSRNRVAKTSLIHLTPKPANPSSPQQPNHRTAHQNTSPSRRSNTYLLAAPVCTK